MSSLKDPKITTDEIMKILNSNILGFPDSRSFSMEKNKNFS